MEYISAEEFLKQDKEVQKVLQDWWISDNNDKSFDLVNWNEKDLLVKDIENGFLDECIPLLTESQLRKFIENNTGGKIRIIEYDFDHYNIITWKEHFITKETNLLQAYWKVAYEIAKEELSHDKARAES